jgi:KEOPS complex subunit Cgi121
MTNNKRIAILGFSNVQIPDTNMFLENFRKQHKNAPIQFFDANHIASNQHLYFAAVNALDAFEKKANISNNLAVEALLYASAQRQITKAVELLGLKQDSTELAALVLTDDPKKTEEYMELVTRIVPGTRDDDVLELTEQKMVVIKELFEISETEFEAKLENKGLEKQALVDLIIERMALLGTRS